MGENTVAEISGSETRIRERTVDDWRELWDWKRRYEERRASWATGIAWEKMQREGIKSTKLQKSKVRTNGGES